MRLGEKIADSIPDSVIEFVHDHPLVLTFATGVLVIVTTALSMSAIALDVRAVDWRRARVGDLQRAASEAHGG